MVFNAGQNGGRMKSLKKIRKEVLKELKENRQEKMAESYTCKLKEEIKGDKYKLLVYKYLCDTEIDLNTPMFWMSTCAVLVSVASAEIALFTNSYIDSETVLGSAVIAGIGLLTIVGLVVLYYTLVRRHRKQYSIVKLVLEQIEKELA